MHLKELVGSGDKIGLLTLPFLIVGSILNVAYPSFFDVGGPSDGLRTVSMVVLIPGITIWIWSVVCLGRVPQLREDPLALSEGTFATVRS